MGARHTDPAGDFEVGCASGVVGSVSAEVFEGSDMFDADAIDADDAGVVAFWVTVATV